MMDGQTCSSHSRSFSSSTSPEKISLCQTTRSPHVHEQIVPPPAPPAPVLRGDVGDEGVEVEVGEERPLAAAAAAAAVAANGERASGGCGCQTWGLEERRTPPTATRSPATLCEATTAAAAA
eukprot:CAMPEP_0115660570 /NCGR_PEP_ID=MMETSP0272-20121206/46321_1 /TAXON_ID=71861 /ORGANISM="Scrippsiella trochoidea, Strain CCMP3099" /LENGTH=121 /DNA_ID=CAMNT_0003098747 /DNA_START=247 /DNA_END=609 /DNA_ORIENTATION=+